jgi:RNA-binding protein
MLTSKRRSALSALASKMEPSVSLGKGGPTEAVLKHLELELARHELVKLRFVDFKEGRRELALELAEKTGAELIRVVGNVAVLYRPDPDPEKRKIPD